MEKPRKSVIKTSRITSIEDQLCPRLAISESVKKRWNMQRRTSFTIGKMYSWYDTAMRKMRLRSKKRELKSSSRKLHHRHLSVLRFDKDYACQGGQQMKLRTNEKPLAVIRLNSGGLGRWKPRFLDVCIKYYIYNHKW